MAIYAIGDIQGCLTALQKLLDRIRFDPISDRLWFVGDLVNRGPDSLEVLRFIKNLGPSSIVVLGNHDLHLLAVHVGIASLNKDDTIQAVLDAPDCEELLFWLRQQPLLYQESEFILVHAGILPQWSIYQAFTLAQEVEKALRSQNYQHELISIYRSSECRWKENYPLTAQVGFAANVFTRMRLCTNEGVLNLSFKGHPKHAPLGLKPWYLLPTSSLRTETIIFGHWSDLGTLVTKNYIAIDGGCVWGNELVGICLDNRKIFKVSCAK